MQDTTIRMNAQDMSTISNFIVEMSTVGTTTKILAVNA